MPELTHFSTDGRVHMVDITAKAVSERTAIAKGVIKLNKKALQKVVSEGTKKGDPKSIAEIAGIMSAKRTSELIPLCHPLSLTQCDVKVRPTSDGYEVTASVKTSGKTGAEMEALTAVSVACLTLYDMLKSVDKSMVIQDIRLIEKSGGKSGDYKVEEK